MGTVVIGFERNFEAFFISFVCFSLCFTVFNIVWSINKQRIKCLAQGHNGVPLRCYLTISEIEDVCSTFNHVNLKFIITGYTFLSIPSAQPLIIVWIITLDN